MDTTRVKSQICHGNLWSTSYGMLSLEKLICLPRLLSENWKTHFSCQTFRKGPFTANLAVFISFALADILLIRPDGVCVVVVITYTTL